jgi:uncharacterized protein (DUF433 family)
MSTLIINRGRGPEIAGTRITVYDILDYTRAGHHHTYIAALFGLSSAQVLAGIKYIEEHQEEVMAEYNKMLERCARGNPPEILAKLEKSRAKLLALREQLRASSTKEEANADGHPGGR